MKKILALFTLITISISLPAFAANLSVTVTDEDKQPLADAVIFLTADNTQVSDVSKEYEVEQRNKMFHPFVTIIPVGSSVMFPNHDGIGHHVYSFSPVKVFQLPLSEAESTDRISFDKPGIVTVGCNIHDWMVAYIYIVETPLFNKTGADGAGTILGIPAGEYLLHITHPGIKSESAVTRTINISDTEDTSLEISMEIKPEYFWRPVQHTDEEEY